ncbi:MAG: ParB/RepB/Spo0J family partition protein [Rhizobiales bacterium]|nr:ParB/RepB/Spo0J family partition protein [Hyphomicrobiales bacterium]
MTERPLFGEITAIDLDQIDITNRLRPVDPAHVEALAVSIEQNGLQSPVILRPEGNRYRLVAGAHRLAACQKLGWGSVDGIIQNVDDDEARLIEIDENLMRRELSVLDRALSLAERKAVYDRLHPETVQRGRRKKELSPTWRQFGERFTKHAAKRTGLSERVVQRSLELAEKLSPEAIARLRLSDLADNQAQLLALAAEEPETQLALASAIADGKAKSPKAARLALGLDVLTEVDPQQKLFEQFMTLWGRAEAPTKAKIVGVVSGFVKPKKGKAGGAA